MSCWELTSFPLEAMTVPGPPSTVQASGAGVNAAVLIIIVFHATVGQVWEVRAALQVISPPLSLCRNLKGLSARAAFDFWGNQLGLDWSKRSA